jgi:hypothetical protein
MQGDATYKEYRELHAACGMGLLCLREWLRIDIKCLNVVVVGNPRCHQFVPAVGDAELPNIN